MAIRNIEIPENQLNKTKKQYNHSIEWLNQKVYILLTVIGKIPFFGMELCKTNKELLAQWLDTWYMNMRQYAFTELKKVIHDTMTPEDHDFSLEKIKEIVIGLEKEFGAEIPELGIEDASSLNMFCRNQKSWYEKNYRWTA